MRESPPPESIAARALPNSRRLLSLSAIVFVGLAAGFAIGSLLKGSGTARTPSTLARGGSAADLAIPAVPTLRAAVVPLALRARPRSRPSASSSTTTSPASMSSSSTVTSVPASGSVSTSSSPPTNSERSAPAVTTPVQKQSAPSHGSGGEAQHKGGGGA